MWEGLAGRGTFCSVLGGMPVLGKNSGLTIPTVTLSSIFRAPLSMGWDKTILPCCQPAMNCPKLLHIV